MQKQRLFLTLFFLTSALALPLAEASTVKVIKYDSMEEMMGDMGRVRDTLQPPAPMVYPAAYCYDCYYEYGWIHARPISVSYSDREGYRNYYGYRDRFEYPSFRPHRYYRGDRRDCDDE